MSTLFITNVVGTLPYFVFLWFLANVICVFYFSTRNHNDADDDWSDSDYDEYNNFDIDTDTDSEYEEDFLFWWLLSHNSDVTTDRCTNLNMYFLFVFIGLYD